MEDISCIFCLIESNHVVVEENGYTAKQCPQCGLIYISPRPSSDDIIDIYKHDDASVSAENHISEYYAKRIHARHHLDIIRSFVNKGALLEIGAGAGYFLEEARKIGFNTFGIEPNPIQANFIKNKLKIPCEDSPLTTSIFEAKKFDVVYHCDVTSHFYDPISEFRKMNEILKDNSFLIFETGNLGDVDPVYFKYYRGFDHPDHLFSYSTESLRILLQITGFDIIKIYRYMIIPDLMFSELLDKAYKLELRGILGRIRSLLYTTVMRNMCNYFNYLLRYKVGYIAPKKSRPQTLIIVAQKRNARDS